MDAFRVYSIPILGLKTGIHLFNYSIDQAFFSHFEDTPIQESQIDIEVQLDRRPDMLIFDFDLTGTVKSVCDRCTAEIDLPLDDTRQLIVKFGEAEGEAEDEVVFISREAFEFNLAKYMYEFAVLALPITNTYNCKESPEPPCNTDILKYLEGDTGEEKSNPIWDALKELKKN
jgi:uncharacterized protein